MKIKRGNTYNVTVAVRDKGNNLITNLATASDIIFVIKNNKNDLNTQALIIKSVLGLTITVDSPNIGYLTFSLSSAETLTLIADKYYTAIEVQYPTSKTEGDLRDNNVYFDTIDVTPGIVE